MSDVPAEQTEYISITADIVSAYLRNNYVGVDGLPGLIQSVHTKLAELANAGSGSKEPPAAPKATTAEIKRSITADYLVSFEDGKPYKTLRRHLTLRGLSAEEYRAKWGLSADYPMTSSSYSAQRSKLAHSLGLGRKRSIAPDEDEG